MIRATLIALIVLAFTAPLDADAELPPLELIQKSVAQKRAKDKTARYNLRFTETGDDLREWTVSGSFSYGAALPGPADRKLSEKSDTAYRLVWIALAAEDPVASLAALGGFVSAQTTDVQVQETFVYVYGKDPEFRVYRDLQRVAGFDLVHESARWSVRLSWDDERVVGLQVTRDGRTVIAGRSTVVRAIPQAE